MNKKYFITGIAEIIVCIIFFATAIALDKPMMLPGIILIWTSGTLLIANNVPSKLTEEEKREKGIKHTIKYKDMRYGKWNPVTIGKSTYSALAVLLRIQYSTLPILTLITGGICALIFVLKMQFEYVMFPLLIMITVTLILLKVFEKYTDSWTCKYCSKNKEDVIKWYYGEEKPNDEQIMRLDENIIYEDGWYMYF